MSLKGCGRQTVSLEEAVALVGKGQGAGMARHRRPLTAEQRELLGKSPFNFHELALEDASKPDGQRAKVEPYDNHFFLVMHSVSPAAAMAGWCSDGTRSTFRRRGLPGVHPPWRPA